MAPIATADVSRWDALADMHGCLFDSSRWVALFGPSLVRLGIYDPGGELRGGFVVWKERRFFIPVLRNPPYTPHVGPFYEPLAHNAAARTDERRAVMHAMAAYLSRTGAAIVSLALSHGATDALPFYWGGWKVVPQYTYHLDLTQSETSLFAALSKERRNDIRKAERDGITVHEVTGTDEMRTLVIETYSRQEMSFPMATTDQVFSGLPPGKESYCFISRAQGHPMAGVFAVRDSRSAYYLIGGYAPGAHHGAGALAMWQAILKAKALGLQVFDFEGSVVPPIERFFRGFGGRLTPYFTVNKALRPIEAALNLHPRYRNRF